MSKMRKYISKTSFILTFFLLIFSSFDAQSQHSKDMVVVLDAGHGGKDPGAVGSKAKEKDITLSVAKKVGNLIKQNCPDVKVYYTRDKDVLVTLNKRAELANSKNADLFISIHCNSIDSAPTTNGIETFIMGEHRNSANLKVAMKENQSMLLEDNNDATYDGFDPNSPESYIMFSLVQSESKFGSLDFAEKVQKQLVSTTKRKNRGLQQAGFWVLYKTSMPSVLIELGFISNKTEEQAMSSEEGQNNMANAIYKAFKEYKDSKMNTSVTGKVEVKSVDNQQVTKDVKTPITDKGTVYKVQFATSSRGISNYKSHFSSVTDVEEVYHNGMYKYTSGSFATSEEAQKHCQSLKNKGYNSAFVVKYVDGVRQ